MGTHFKGRKKERRALDAYIKLSRAASAVEKAINQHLSDHHLTISQFGVLEALYHLGPLHQNALGEKILKSSGNMTLVVDNLAKRGLIERQRDSTDRRYLLIQLSDKGRKLIGTIFPQHVEKVLEAFGVLSKGEQEKLAELCRTLGLAQLEQSTIDGKPK